MAEGGRIGLLVGGGPAPGINTVIASATARAELEGVPVVGITAGFKWLMAGEADRVVELTGEETAALATRGGVVLGTSRANPTTSEVRLATTVASLQELGVDRLVTIGGDDTAYSAMRVAGAARQAGVALKVVHVPKTIDNDLDLPPEVDTFGFQTARHLGTELVKNLLADAQATGRWYFVVAMGRKAGHLALGIGAAAGATVTLVAEEWPGGVIELEEVVDTLVGAVLKRRALGRPDGVAVIAEGIAERFDAEQLEALGEVERDEHGHIRLAEIDLGTVLKRRVEAALAELGLELTIVTKDIGYELRCQDPVASDLIYCRQLGLAAVEFLLGGGSEAMISVQHGVVVPIPFDRLLDPETGRARVRLLDTASVHYSAARRFMTRLERTDFQEPQLSRLSRAAGLSAEAFRARFEPVVARQVPPRPVIEKSRWMRR